MRPFFTAFIAIALSGCASHAQFQAPDSYKIVSDDFNQKTIHHDILYSQPEPGILNDIEQQPMSPIGESELSSVSRRTLANTDSIIQSHLPAGMATVTSETSADYLMSVRIKAYKKHGPTAWDYEFLKSFGIGLFTLGLGPDLWDITAEFDAVYELKTNSGSTVHQKRFEIRDKADHQAAFYESLTPLYRASKQLYEQQLHQTLNTFFKQVEEKGFATQGS
ncbi:hypothetical protein C8D92_104222 [Tamilnaduibacter salinus]|uniref:Lipoprotein n=1 Tax=Tamilnaduibacter salinus TaxID=1484056 RepID=A0A2U1CXN7_9GAMM|nr:hypothetical protein [Tamilnaduibacter salinus]PVY76989.1 hypothetical protein C8D92_104222 [Tamilnaduibacter salinus]